MFAGSLCANEINKVPLFIVISAIRPTANIYPSETLT